MKSFTVLEPPLPAADGAPEGLRLVFVKQGFCWPALIVTLPWMLLRGLFVEAAVYVVVMAGLAALATRGGAPVGALVLMVPLALGILGNDIRRFALARRGFRTRGTVSGATIDEAEIRYFLGGGFAEPLTAPGPAAGPAARMTTQGPGEPVIGMFPQPERAR